jgi:hypothetical protein
MTYQNTPLFFCKKNAPLFFFFLAFFFSPFFISFSEAALIRSGDSYVVEVDTTLQGDLYFAGKNFTFKGYGEEDVLVFSLQSANIEGGIGSDAHIIAPRIEHTGIVHGDMRSVGGVIDIYGTVKEDLFVLGLEVVLHPSAVIEGDLFVLWGDVVRLYGKVEGSTNVSSRFIDIRGNLVGPVTLKAGEILSVHDDAVIENTFSYIAPREMRFSEKADIKGALSFSQKEEEKKENILFTFVLYGITLFSLAFFVLWLFPFSAKKIVEENVLHPKGWALLLGISSFIFIFPFVSFLAFTGIGIFIAVFIFVVYSSLLFFALALTPLFFGTIGALLFKKKTENFLWHYTILGSFLVVLLFNIPFVGFFIILFAWMLLMGSVLLSFFTFLRKKETP